MADHRDCFARVAALQPKHLGHHAVLHFTHEFTARSARAAAKRVEAAPVVPLVEIRDEVAFKIARVHFAERLDALRREPVRFRNVPGGLNRALQRACVDRLQRVLRQPDPQTLGLRLSRFVEVPPRPPSHDRLSDGVRFAVAYEQEGCH